MFQAQSILIVNFNSLNTPQNVQVVNIINAQLVVTYVRANIILLFISNNEVPVSPI